MNTYQQQGDARFETGDDRAQVGVVAVLALAPGEGALGQRLWHGDVAGTAQGCRGTEDVHSREGVDHERGVPAVTFSALNEATRRITNPPVRTVPLWPSSNTHRAVDGTTGLNPDQRMP
jgi:hypothetical protein